MSEALTRPLPVAGPPGHARIADVRLSPGLMQHAAPAGQILVAWAYGSACASSPTRTVRADEATSEVLRAVDPFNFMPAATKTTRRLRGSHAQTQMNAGAARYPVADFNSCIPRVARRAALAHRLRANQVLDAKCRMPPDHRTQACSSEPSVGGRWWSGNGRRTESVAVL